MTASVKIIFQRLCKDGLDWDADVPDEILLHWKNFLRDLENLRLVKVDRYITCSKVIMSSTSDLQIHGFCDSSKQAYYAAIYFRILDLTGIQVRLVAAKTKVAPLNPFDTFRLRPYNPRLGLSGPVGIERVKLTSSRF